MEVNGARSSFPKIAGPEDVLTAMVAVALYQYNVSPGERAERLYHHFGGACAEPNELLRLVDVPSWATGMAWPTAKAYLMHAMERYGDEARDHVRLNEKFDHGF